jgi:hypothetical protein
MLLPATTARGTWSIVVCNKQSKEVGIASATCLTSFDLLTGLPMVLVDVGAGAAQSQIDSGETNRRRMRLQMQFLQTHPIEIIRLLGLSDSSHQNRQYGIVDTKGRMATFTGANAGPFADGITGRFGDWSYAIQGNVITGLPVLRRAEDALIHTPGDLPEKLMAAMEAAREMGGDGRCSCRPNDPPGCGSPPPEFEKSAHIGFMVVTRTGDTDGSCGSGGGCANGSYFMRFNVRFQSQSDPDPVFQLRDMFDTWRAALIARPDAVRSTVALDPPRLPVGEEAMSTMTLAVRDWQGNAVDGDSVTVSVTHAGDSDGIAAIGAVQHVGGGVFEIPLTGSGAAGRDRFTVEIDDGQRPVFPIPVPVLFTGSPADFNHDGVVDETDFALFGECFIGPEKTFTQQQEQCLITNRLDDDGDLDISDFAIFSAEFGR